VVARRLRLNVRPGDLVGRLGGDEFLVFCPGAGEREAATIRERLRQCLQEPVLVGEVACRVSASIGVSTGTPLQGVTAHQLITDADTAMYAEKRAHRDNARTDVGLTGCAGGR
jgi:diguanylate cyclase (GGDEF)-like protein